MKLLATFLTVFFFPTLNLQAQYCFPGTINGSVNNDYINSITIDSKYYNGTSSSYDSIIQGFGCFIELDRNYAHSFQVSTSGSSATYALFIDYNSNSDFGDPQEKLGEYVSGNTPDTWFSILSFPQSTTDTVRARLRCVGGGVTNIDPCATYSYGVTLDFEIIVTNLSPFIPARNYCYPEFQCFAQSSQYFDLLGPNMNFNAFNRVDFVNNSSTSLIANSTVVFSMRSPGQYFLWADYNQDGDFDDLNEYIGEEYCLPPTGGPITPFAEFVIQIPADAKPGLTLFRLRSRPLNGFGNLPLPAACQDDNYNNTVDFVYTIQSYCNQLHATSCTSNMIESVEILGTSLSNTSNGCTNLSGNSYSMFPPTSNTTASLEPGSLLKLVVKMQDSSAAAAWFDFDNNSIFDSTEFYLITNLSSQNYSDTLSILLPDTLQNKSWASFRIRATSYLNPLNAIDACKLIYEGETEDYAVSFTSPLVNVTFKLDMAPAIADSIFTVGVHTVDFFRWLPGGTFSETGLSYEIGTLYKKTLTSFHEGDLIQYKFRINHNWSTFEVTSRPYKVTAGDTVLNVWNSSSIVITEVTFKVPITFRVDMSHELISPQGIRMVGNFNDWDLDSTLMSSIGNGIYEATIMLDTASTIVYKFINGDIYSSAETINGNCAVNFQGYGNCRYLEIPEASDTLQSICFNSCSPCAGLSLEIDTVSIPTVICSNSNFLIGYTSSLGYLNGNIFQIQLSDSVGNFSSPIVLGNVTSTVGGSITAVFPSHFSGNGYLIRLVSTSPYYASQPITISVANNPAAPIIVEKTDTLICESNGSSFQWYFNNNLLPGATNDTLIFTINGNYKVCILDMNSCENCSSILTSVFSSDYNPILTATPNPFESELSIKIAVHELRNYSLKIIDELGVTVYFKTQTSRLCLIQTQNWLPGIYFLLVEKDGAILQKRKLIKVN